MLAGHTMEKTRESDFMTGWPHAQLCVIITGVDPQQEARTEGLNTGSQCKRSLWCLYVCVCARVSDGSVVSFCKRKTSNIGQCDCIMC